MPRKHGLWPSSSDFSSQLMASLSFGVDIFFVISGYLITASLIRHNNIKAFLIDRCIRIYPLFLSLHVIIFAVAPIIGYKWFAGISLESWLINFVSNLLFLPGIFNLPLAQLNAWSLSYEALFYIIAALFYSFRGKKFAIILLALTILPIFYFHPRALFLAVGVAIYFLHQNQLIITKRLAIFPDILSLIILALALSHAQENILFYGIAIIFAALLFNSIAYGYGIFAAILKHPAMQFMGNISYSFYLLHAFVMFAAMGVCKKILIHYFPILPVYMAFALLSTAVTIAVSYISYLLLEKKASALIRRHFVARKPAVSG